MKAYLCSIGEPTTDIVKEILQGFGFEVILLDEVEPWYDKYKKFIFQATEKCIRIDADIIPNKNIRDFKTLRNGMHQASGYDMYKNEVGIMSPVFYSKEVLEIIRKNWHLVTKDRPETSASRIPEVNKQFFTSFSVVGIHGIYQRKEDIDRHKQHKIDRKQIDDYHFELTYKLQALWEKD